MDIRRFFDRSFDTILAAKLAGLGYEIETKWKPDGKYHSWDIKGIPEPVIERNSRRSAEIEPRSRQSSTVSEARRRRADAPDQLSAVARDKLGQPRGCRNATT